MMDIREATFIAVDLETTGLDPKKDDIIAVATIPIRNMKIILRDAFFSLVRPGSFCLESMKYHGICEEDLENAPDFSSISERLYSVLNGILVGHCVEIDYSFLRQAFKRVGIKFKTPYVDIVEIEKWIRRKTSHSPKCEDLNLDALIRAYGLKASYRHNALADAFFAAQIFQIQVMTNNITTVEHLFSILSHQKACNASFVV